LAPGDVDIDPEAIAQMNAELEQAEMQELPAEDGDDF